jgi:hypothetical protein
MDIYPTILSAIFLRPACRNRSLDMLLKDMESQTLTHNPILPQTGAAESKMRQSLGLGGSTNGSLPSSPANDPMKAARQAIRSQVTAREYTERQLAQAQGAIQDLRTKLRHVHQERETAISAAQSAMMAKDHAERTMRAAETALATERATRIRTEGTLRDAEATIRDLREKLATANHALQTMRAEISAERLARAKAGDVPLPAMATPETVVATVQEVIAPIVRRPVGRPRKTVFVEAGQASMLPITEPQVIRNTAVPAVRRPVGRPRKTAMAQPVEQPIGLQENLPVSTKVGRNKVTSRADNQEPIQWWIEGWKKQ